MKLLRTWAIIYVVAEFFLTPNFGLVQSHAQAFGGANNPPCYNKAYPAGSLFTPCDDTWPGQGNSHIVNFGELEGWFGNYFATQGIRVGGSIQIAPSALGGNVIGGVTLYDKFGQNAQTVEPGGVAQVRDMSNPNNLVWTLTRGGCTAVNATSSITLTPPAGQSVYISHLGGYLWQDATSTAVVTGNYSVTNVVNTSAAGAKNLTAFSAAATPDLYMTVLNESYTPPIKSVTPGAAVVISMGTAGTDVGYCTTVAYAFGP